MLQVARLATKILGESTPLVEPFLPQPTPRRRRICATAAARATCITRSSAWKDWRHPGGSSAGPGRAVPAIVRRRRGLGPGPPGMPGTLLGIVSAGPRVANGAATSCLAADRRPSFGRWRIRTCSPELRREAFTDASWPWGPIRMSASACPGPRGCWSASRRPAYGRWRLHEPRRSADRPDAVQRGRGGLAAATRCRAGPSLGSGC